jgi:hypothetical protein
MQRNFFIIRGGCRLIIPNSTFTEPFESFQEISETKSSRGPGAQNLGDDAQGFARLTQVNPRQAKKNKKDAQKIGEYAKCGCFLQL